MSDFSLTLVLQFNTSKIINDMAKVQIKSEKITAFGGIFFVLDKFEQRDRKGAKREAKWREANYYIISMFFQPSRL